MVNSNPGRWQSGPGDSLVEIVRGLKPGDEVIASATYLLDSESNLAAAMQSLMLQMGMGLDMGGMTAGKRESGEAVQGMEGMKMGGEESDDRAVDRLVHSRRGLVAVFALALLIAGSLYVRSTPVDAIPDLSDVQVIVYTDYPARRRRWWRTRSPIRWSTALLAVPRAKRCAATRSSASPSST